MNVTVLQAPERSGPVILSAAKDLAAGRERPFAALRMTRFDCSNGQEPFVHIEPCLNKLSGISHLGNEAPVGADLSCAPPIYRPTGTPPHIPIILFIIIIGQNEGQSYSDYFVKPHKQGNIGAYNLETYRLTTMDARHYLHVHRGPAQPYLKSIWQPACNR